MELVTGLLGLKLQESLATTPARGAGVPGRFWTGGKMSACPCGEGGCIAPPASSRNVVAPCSEVNSVPGREETKGFQLMQCSLWQSISSCWASVSQSHPTWKNGWSGQKQKMSCLKSSLGESRTWVLCCHGIVLLAQPHSLGDLNF